MKLKAVSGIMLTLLLANMLGLAFDIQSVKASGTIYIRADESVDTLELVSTITLDKEPESIAVNEETNLVYVGVEGGLRVIDGETKEVVAEVSLEFTAEFLAINPQTNRIFVGGEETPDYATYVIDCNTNLMVGQLVQAEKSYEIAINPTTNLVYIARSANIMGRADTISVNDEEAQTSTTHYDYAVVVIPGSREHRYIERVGVAVNPETNRIYAMWSGDNTLHVIDGDTHEIVKTVSPSSFSATVMVNPFTNYVYVGNVVLDGETLEEVLSDYEGYLEAVDPVNNLLYTVDHHNLYVLNGTTHGILASLELDEWIYDLAANSKTGETYIAHGSGKQISVVQERASYPPAFVISNLDLEPEKVDVGEPFTVTVNVTNIGELAGSHTVKLEIAGTVVDTRNVTLAGGESTTVSFQGSKEEQGTYEVGINGQIDTITISAPTIPITPLYMLFGVIVVIAIIGIVAFVALRRRKLPHQLAEKLNPAIS